MGSTPFLKRGRNMKDAVKTFCNAVQLMMILGVGAFMNANELIMESTYWQVVGSRIDWLCFNDSGPAIIKVTVRHHLKCESDITGSSQVVCVE